MMALPLSPNLDRYIYTLLTHGVYSFAGVGRTYIETDPHAARPFGKLPLLLEIPVIFLNTVMY